MSTTPTPTKAKPTSPLKLRKLLHCDRGLIFFTITFCEALTSLPPLLHFFLPNAAFQKLPPFFYILNVQMFPVLGQLEGEGKAAQSVLMDLRNTGLQRAKQECKALVDYQTPCSWPPPAHYTPSFLRKGSFCSQEYLQQLPQSCLGTCRTE